jgi:hypothetical protein
VHASHLRQFGERRKDPSTVAALPIAGKCAVEHRDVTVAEALAAVMDQEVEVVEGPGWAGDIGPSVIRRTVQP